MSKIYPINGYDADVWYETNYKKVERSKSKNMSRSNLINGYDDADVWYVTN